MKTFVQVEDSFLHLLLDNYLQRYRAFLLQRDPGAMGWKEIAYGYSIALVDDISFLIQHCNYETKATIISKLKAESPILLQRVLEELAKPKINTNT